MSRRNGKTKAKPPAKKPSPALTADRARTILAAERQTQAEGFAKAYKALCKDWNCSLEQPQQLQIVVHGPIGQQQSDG